MNNGYMEYTSTKSKWFALLFCCIGFVGVGGVQYFYVGRYMRGILYVLTGGLFGIGTIVDVILILLGRFTDHKGIPLRQ